MSKQLASLIKAAVFDLGDAEENGFQVLLISIERNGATVTPRVGFAQQTADGGLTFATLPVGTLIRYTQYNLANGESVTPPPIPIYGPPIYYPPGDVPESQPVTETALYDAAIGGNYLYSITSIDIPGATFRQFGQTSFNLNTVTNPEQ